MKPGCDGVRGAAERFEQGSGRADHADHAALGRRVVGLPAVARDARGGRERDDPRGVGEVAGGQQRLVDRQLRRDVHRQHGLPLVGRHVGEQLVARDAGVVHDDVDPPVPLQGVLEDPRAGVGRGDVELQGRAAHPVGDGDELLAGRGDVDGDDGGTVARERVRDRLADAARGAGDDGDAAVERPVPVRGQRAGRRVDREQLSVHERRPRRQEEPQRADDGRRGDRDVAPRTSPFAGRTAAQLLGDRPQETVDPLPCGGDRRRVVGRARRATR